MAAIFSFKCGSCGQVHEGSPSIAFEAPAYWSDIPENERPQRGKLDSDLCKADQHYFVRVCLDVPIIGVSDGFLWGVWASVSETNFKRCLETWDAPDEDDAYFGWLQNRLPYYPDTLNLKTMIRPKKGGSRPMLELEPTDHPLTVDYREGITIARAQEIAEFALHRRRDKGAD